ncbi:hypothetical protein LTR37_007548 [Vermiconidia calcicola]|uniref:Uncharacterized protein n=1 Tax=Vermiconidia calcicola TaxID=1690605 RepID=A0ACC3NDC5_9PEZI|nr:hypothetical protein LTR37_007548 [Vermiconidia calcicola]
MSLCQHPSLSFEALETPKFTYRQPTALKLEEALSVSQPAAGKKRKTSVGKAPKRQSESGESNIRLPPSSTFPAPVVVPGDELFHDPDDPPQSVQEWINGDWRNDVTRRRRTIYVVPPPGVSDEVGFVDGWTNASSQSIRQSSKKGKQTSVPEPANHPRVEDVLEYLQAFYHGLPVKLLDKPGLEFIAWDGGRPPRKSKMEDQNRTNTIRYISLSTGREAVRVRCRPSLDGAFAGQLNLDDLLDTTISILPSDAYALIMLLHHDLYEDEDDDFCCGRAYGGSRVAVISTARYRPELDKKQKIDVEHSWPGSHCSAYIRRLHSGKLRRLQETVSDSEPTANSDPESAMQAAVTASHNLPLPVSSSQLSTLWLGRVCKTASHELGHCFGIDHCVYYACIMQGTARMEEDVRQPPYLCPIDLSKMLRATGTDRDERYRALLEFSRKWEEDRMFAAFGAWIEARLNEQRAIDD